MIADRTLRRDLLVVAALAMLKGIVWATAYPIWKIADEPSHFDNIQYRAEWNKAPQYHGGKMETVIGPGMSDEMKASWKASQRYWREKHLRDEKTVPEEATLAELAVARGARNTNGQMTSLHYPALFYSVAQVPYRIFRTASIVTRVYAIRITSALYGVLAALSAFLAARRILRDRMLAIAATAIVTLNPVASQMTSAINNDAAMIGLGAFVFLCQIEILCAKVVDYRWAAALGLGLGLALITKPQAVALGPAAAACFAPHLLRRESFRRGVIAAGLAVVATLIVFGPSMREQLALGGMFKTLAEAQFGKSLKPLIPPGYLDYLESLHDDTFRTYFWQAWAQFGWLEFSLPPAWMSRLLAPSLLVKIGLLTATVMYIVREGADRIWFAGRGLLLAGFTLVVAVLFMLYVEYNCRANVGLAGVIQGRGFLFALPPLAVLIVAGLGSLTPARLRGITAAAIVTAMVSLHLAGLVAVYEFYYGA